MFMEIVVVYRKKSMDHINALCGQNAGFINVAAGGTFNYHKALGS
jgi:hypothetical protein